MQDNGKVTRSQVFFVALLAAGFATCYAVFSGLDGLHEIGHAIFVVLRGGEVRRFTLGYIVATGYDGMSLYMGTGFAIIVRAIALIWLARRNANPAVIGWIWGRLIMEWLAWFIGNGNDASMMEWAEYVLWTGLHISAFAGLVVGASVMAIGMLIDWQPKPVRIAQQKAKALVAEMMRRAA